MHTGELPLVGNANQAADHGILMNVEDGSRELGSCANVAVEAASLLPESRPAGRLNLLQDPGIKISPPANDSPRNRVFDAKQDTFERGRCGRPKQDVNVFGHDDIGKELEAEAGSGSRQCLEKQPRDGGMSQQWQAAMTGKRYEANIAEAFTTLHPLADRGDRSHLLSVLRSGTE